ncbi:hypothetical protein GCM10011609_29470 [Lentzea pudingi]|uniref:NB-ARC domain-containing protein n=1 Tax=Lentzea pudingi TaxID=1789439 RepID=A0ABQ2HSU8_9PSEU|nr:hypothetical protein GCM10011609_29470 [Lentzea pudingi]
MPQERVANTVDAEVVGTVLQAGTITGGVHIHQPRTVGPAAVLPFRVGVVPPRATSFQKRAASDLVASVLDAGDAAVPISDSAGQATVLTGLGGVGKTQLAAEYAERVWAAGEVELLVWVTAGSREAIMSTYARAVAMLTGVEDSDPARSARSLLEWLAGTAVSWLVVLDDVQTPGDLVGLWPPLTEQGLWGARTLHSPAELQ